MKILVTGANGQLGRDVVNLLLRQGHEVFGPTRNELDITDQIQCGFIISKIKPDVVVHCAAYTAVDKAESDCVTAFQVNANGTRNLAVLAEKCNFKLCYVSTDYVFDGKSSVPYLEYDSTNPVTIYGKSKRAGEIMVQTLSSRYFIVRTSWVYGLYGNNFVKTMLKLGTERNEIKVVSDQLGSPTLTIDLARFIAELIPTEKYGIYHASNQGQCSWFEFAQAIFDEAGMKQVSLLPCSTEEFPRPAPRPAYSVMEHLAIRTNGLTDLPEWRSSLKTFIGHYCN
ncbi:dTDP-4-dehydrorhamnose reductase [Paenibacillus taiwanensis]|uniref:dTDP-4-dehydrorhamnose reductase n=1 Tax=Paenibacillus taiwanensis TaxID=401638 RepID=UPI0003FCFF2A|nr:dTDP-4-dehydrorhamnose reductase [Paenibacillus taiwanensis]